MQELSQISRYSRYGYCYDNDDGYICSNGGCGIDTDTMQESVISPLDKFIKSINLEKINAYYLEYSQSTWQGQYGFSIGIENNPIDLTGERVQSFTFLDCKNNVCAVEYNALHNYVTCDIKNNNFLSLQIHSHKEATLFIKHDRDDIKVAGWIW